MIREGSLVVSTGETIKAQRIRLLDVFVVGPLMIWGGAALSERRPVSGSLLGIVGVLTVLYNGSNYLRIRRVLESANGD